MKSGQPPASPPGPLYLGVKGSVMALDAATRTQLWVTHLKSSGFVHIVLEGDNLYAATYGEVFCLDPQTGAKRWHNPLKGYGLGLVSIATENTPISALLNLAAERQRQDAESSAAMASFTAAAAS